MEKEKQIKVMKDVQSKQHKLCLVRIRRKICKHIGINQLEEEKNEAIAL